jgi:hypothetical protein
MTFSGSVKHSRSLYTFLLVTKEVINVLSCELHSEEVIGHQKSIKVIFLFLPSVTHYFVRPKDLFQFNAMIVIFLPLN